MHNELSEVLTFEWKYDCLYYRNEDVNLDLLFCVRVTYYDKIKYLYFKCKWHGFEMKIIYFM